MIVSAQVLLMFAVFQQFSYKNSIAKVIKLQI
jgi:hypothetical protein